jgi:hypothetical protein
LAVPPPLGRACPCCVVGQAGGPCTTRAFGPCRHGHGGSRAVQPMGRSKRPCRGPCCRPMGCLEIYKQKLIFSAYPPYLARQLSVRKVVPTLTSNERWDQPLDGSVLATKDTGFILVPTGAVRPAVACSRHYIALHRGARRGGLQAWRERRPGLQVPEVLIEANANIVVEAECVRVLFYCRVSPAARGSPLLL